MNITEPYQKLNICKDTFLLFDMDGTLINTDLANFLSYRDAIESVIKFEEKLHYNPELRFNRLALTNLYPNLTDKEYETIIKKKEDTYPEYIQKTELKNSVVDILLQYSKTNRTILVTNCRKNRALQTLKYHNLTDKFCDKFFRVPSEKNNRINKYKNVISCLNLSTQSVIVFENEKQEIDDAISAGISANNIFSL
jgi:phosphoglycolate phosphatase-like HAD superfamily hydrolase